MTQLWMWKYNGQDEVGIKSAVDKQELFRTDDFYSLATQHSRRTIGQVTDLHKVKVVDADAITISRNLWLEIQEPNPGSVGWQHAFRWMVKEIKKENPQLTPPVTEPTGFGAVVEAQVSEINKPQRLVHSGHGFWILEGGTERSFTWDRLINPVVISEGQK